eukprot:gene11932-biopygen9062
MPTIADGVAAVVCGAVPAGTCPDCGAVFAAGATASSGHRGLPVDGTADKFSAWLRGHRGRAPCRERRHRARHSDYYSIPL